MRRFLAICLCFTMIFSLFSCSSLEDFYENATITESVTTTEKTDEAKEEESKGIHDPTGFAVGFGRETVNPTKGIGLGGYGNTSSRRSDKILDDLFITCICISDGEEKILLYSVDFLSVSKKNFEQVAKLIDKNLSIPSQNIFITATHTHAAPHVRESSDSVVRYMSTFYQGMLRAAKSAVEDLDRAEMYIGTGKTDSLNYVRRYFREDGTFHGVNIYSNSTSPVVKHETDADEEMQVIRFDRKNQKDVVMVNWQCHATSTGGLKKTNVSADFVGAFRKTAEEENDILFAYYQGAAGNVVPSSYISTEKKTADHIEHGKELASTLKTILSDVKKVETGTIKTAAKTYYGYYETDFSGFNLDQAKEIKAAFAEENSDKVKSLCLKYGYHSYYHANGILNRSSRKEGAGTDIDMGAISIGNIAFIGAPYEMFDTNGMQIKEASPFEMTFICAYTNNSLGYIPSALGFQNGGYEVDGCAFRAGLGEELVAEYVEMLEELNH